MHILGYRVQPIVPVVAALGLLTAATVYRVLRSRGTNRQKATFSLLFTWVVILTLSVSLAPDVGRAGAGTCAFRISFEPAWTADQRLLNVAMYAPIGFFGVLAVGTGRSRVAVCVATLALAILLEWIQLAKMVGRSCDVIDVIDGWTGAVLGVAAATVIILRRRRFESASANARR